MNPDKELLTLRLKVKAFESKAGFEQSWLKWALQYVVILVVSLIAFLSLDTKNPLVSAVGVALSVLVLQFIVTRIAGIVWNKYLNK